MDIELQKQHNQACNDAPPGTIQLQERNSSVIVLSPRPSSDPNDPLNWSARRKWQQITLLCLYTVIVDACLTVATPMWSVMEAEDDVNFSSRNLNNSYAAGTGALALGCIIFVPFALVYGRRPLYLFTSATITGMAVWSAKMETSGALFATQILMGLVGIVNRTLFEISVADMFFVHQRGTVNGLYFAMTVIGNFLAPVAAGYVTASQGWRWGYWWIAILCGGLTVLMVFLLEESKYTPIVNGYAIEQTAASKATKESKAGANERDDPSAMAPEPITSQDRSHIDHSIPMKPYWKRLGLIASDGSGIKGKDFIRHFWRPFVIVCTVPAVAFCAVTFGFGFSCLSIVLVTQAVIYPEPPYNFSSIGVGNVVLAPAIGGILGSIVGGVATDALIVKLAKRKGGRFEPEMRLQLFALPGLALPAGLLVYGLTIAKGEAWIINAVGSALVMFSVSGCVSIAVTYVQDSYLQILGDSLIGVSFVNNGIATALIFAVPPWMESMGVYNMFVLLGCLAVVVNASYVLFLIWGKRWRGMTAERYHVYALQQLESRPM